MIPLESFLLDASTPGTLQARLRQMIAQAILSGRFRPGERLPSSRALARHLKVSRITVTLAYTELTADDYLISKGRSGTYISPNAPEPPAFAPQAPAVSTVDWDARLGPALPRPWSDRPPDWASYRYNFIYGQPDPTLFDAANWRLCALQALGRKEWPAIAPDSYDQDDPLLVDFIARQILPRRGILAAPDEILVTLGAQNALWLAARLLAPGRLAAMEDPGYPALRAILTEVGAQTAPIPVDAQGLPPDLVPRGAALVFVTPSHQCPTAITMPLERRQVLLQMAESRDLVVIEDDYDTELPSPATKPSLKALDRGGRVVHVGSFSKSIFPGLRLGYLVAPAPFIARARALRALTLRHPPGLIQRTVAHFLSLGHYDALLRRTARAYGERQGQVLTGLTEAGIEVTGGQGGSSLWLRRPGRDMTAESLRLRKLGVLIEPGEGFFAAPGGAEWFRLAWSSIPVARVAEGVGFLSS
jgi:GntR family transcriptional regulator/MocR family aminotransferase